MVNSFSDKDHSTMQEIIEHLHRCNSRQSLKTLFETRILPQLKAHSALYAWLDPDLLSPKLIDCINIPEQEISSINEFIENNPKAGLLLTHTHPVIARDIDFSNGSGMSQEDPFIKGASETEKGYGYFNTSQTGVITLALRDANLAAGIHRRLPCEKNWSVRDVCFLEQIRPHLLMTIKTIVLTEELARHKSLVDILADSPTAMAVIDRDMHITYNNPSWEELFPRELGASLAEDLAELLENEKIKYIPPFERDANKIRELIYPLSSGDYKLCFSPIKGKSLDDQDPWLLQVKPVQESRSRLELLRREAGLTKREVEACDLLRQGIDAAEIANRLFISPHTVKTHLKRIHQKLGVHARAQLVATLNNFELS